MIGNLARVDRDHKIEPVLPQLVSKLNTGRMITAGNTIKALAESPRLNQPLPIQLTREMLEGKKLPLRHRQNATTLPSGML